MPSQASLAAGVLQTGMRLSIPVGLAITFAVYGSVAQTPRGLQDHTWPFNRAFLCSVIFAVVSLMFVPFMKIGKQGKRSLTPSVANSSTTAVNDPRFRGGGTDGTGGVGFADGHHMARGSQGSLWSAATAGSFDSYFPRWSWEEYGRDRDRHYDDNVVYEVCIKCLTERRVHVQQEQEEGYEHEEANEDAVYDVEGPLNRSMINVGVDLTDRTYFRDSGASIPPSAAAQFQRGSSHPYTQDSEQHHSWNLTSVDRPPFDEYRNTTLAPPARPPRRMSSNNPYRRESPEVRYDNPVTGERVLLSGYRSSNAVSYQTQPSLRQSNNPYRRDIVDYRGSLLPPQPPELATPPLPQIRPARNALPPSTETSTQETSGMRNLQQYNNTDDGHTSLLRGTDTTFEFPSSIINGRNTVSTHVRNRSIMALRDPVFSLSPPPLQLKHREGFTSVELDRVAESSRYTRESALSVISAPQRVLNSREMAIHYSAVSASVLSPRRSHRREATQNIIVNPEGYEPRAARDIGTRSGGHNVPGWV